MFSNCFNRNFSSDTSVVCWDQVGLVRLGIFDWNWVRTCFLALEMGPNFGPKPGDREPLHNILGHFDIDF